MLVAHISDPHIGPLPAPRLKELLGKRFTGYVNWRRGRAVTHDMALLERVLTDLAEQAPDHVAFTGDITNIGLAAEFPIARAFIQRLGPPERVSFVPGNHDAYVRGSLKPLGHALGPWMKGDDTPANEFPFVRRRDGVAFVGLSSAIPTLPFVASGTLGEQQLGRLAEILAALTDERLCRVVLVHHPPFHDGAKPGRQLTDADAFERVIARTGAELVLHGHNHRSSLARIRGPEKPVPVLGAPSASASRGLFTDRAGYHLVRIVPDGARSLIQVRTRGLVADKQNIGDRGEIEL